MRLISKHLLVRGIPSHPMPWISKISMKFSQLQTFPQCTEMAQMGLMGWRERALQDDLGIAQKGAKVPGVVRLQEGQRGRLVPEHILPVRVIADAGVPPFAPEPRSHRRSRLQFPARPSLVSVIPEQFPHRGANPLHRGPGPPEISPKHLSLQTILLGRPHKGNLAGGGLIWALCV